MPSSQAYPLLALALLLIPHTIAHFHLTYPPARSSDESGTTYPCGDDSSVSTPRTSFPLSNAPIMIDDEHTEAMVGVAMALGNNPRSSDFTIQLVPTMETHGPQNFCFGGVDAANVLGMSVQELDGMNATISVSTGSHVEGGEGLYKCADITFTSTPLSMAEYNDNCMNSTGVTVMTLDDGSEVNPNGTAVGGGSTSSASSSSSSSSAASASTSASTGGEPNTASNGYVIKSVVAAVAVSVCAATVLMAGAF